MTDDRKAELAHMCRLEIRRTVTLAQMTLADYGYHLAMSVFDAEFQAMLDRCSDKPFVERDVPALMELVMEDLWPRLREVHKEHRDQVFKHLKMAHPETISEDAKFELDVGWAALIQAAAARVETYPTSWSAKITGGKEKLGCLVLHIACDYDRPGCRSEIERLREEVRLRSLSTCDICGGQGRLRLSSIAKTVCDKHSAILGDMREDDGLWADPYRWRDELPIEDHIADVMATGRAAISAAEETALGKRIDEDTWQRRGREQELLIEFGGVIEDVVNGACAKEEFIDDYIDSEIDGWRTTAVVPVSDRDREFLHGYLRELIDGDRNK